MNVLLSLLPNPTNEFRDTYECTSSEIIIPRKSLHEQFRPYAEPVEDRGNYHEANGQTYHLAFGVVMIHRHHDGRRV